MCRVIAVFPVQYYQLHKVIVEVTDINDHAPVFPADSFQLNISEWKQPGSWFSLPVADDSDSGRYAVTEYQLQPREMQRIFALHVVTEADGSQRVRGSCLSPNSTWLVTSHLDTNVRRVQRVETRVSNRAV